MATSQILGFVGTALVIGGYIPQIVHLIKERCTAGISVPAFSLWCAASLLFLIHAAMIRDLVFVGVQIVNLVAGALIVVFCKRYDGEVCPFHREAYSSFRTGRKSVPDSVPAQGSGFLDRCTSQDRLEQLRRR
jgi:uncharacterized protein with PQ loop repeat